MAHCEFENDVNGLMELNKPLNSGPIARWERKAAEKTVLKNSLYGLSMTRSQHQNSMNNSPKSLNASASNKTPGKVSTPSSLKKKTPGKPKPSNQNISLSKTPSRSDRFIPNRQATNFELGHFKLLSENVPDKTGTLAKEEYKRRMTENLQKVSGFSDEERILAFRIKPTAAEGYQNTTKVLYSSTKKSKIQQCKIRHISSTAIRVLDAPDLANDFYLNLIDWSSQNKLAAVLSRAVYLWDAFSGDIKMLMCMEGENEYISSVKWIADGQHIAIGNSNAEVQLWDVNACRRIRNMTSHAGRISSLCWNSHILTSGSQDGYAHHHDVRIQNHHVATLTGHTQEICGLDWSKDGQYLATGGNDNLVNIYYGMDSEPVYSLSDHQAAVKALAWCPWQYNVLVSGGGSGDRHLRFWNAHNGSCIKAVDTQSQVCDVKWSTHYKELVSSHGYAHNQLTIWSYPTIQWMQDLMGHTGRVLYLALSPDGQTVCSGAADETLRLWDCFALSAQSESNKKASERRKQSSSRIDSLFSIR